MKNNDTLPRCAAYKYKGYLFEVHSYLGPATLKKDLNLKVKQPSRYSKFWKIYSDFEKLTPKQRQRYQL